MFNAGISADTQLCLTKGQRVAKPVSTAVQHTSTDNSQSGGTLASNQLAAKTANDDPQHAIGSRYVVSV